MAVPQSPAPKGGDGPLLPIKAVFIGSLEILGYKDKESFGVPIRSNQQQNGPWGWHETAPVLSQPCPGVPRLEDPPAAASLSVRKTSAA